MVDYILNRVTNRSENLPPSGTLTLRPQTAWARISSGDRRKQIWGNGCVRTIKIVESDTQGLSLVAESVRGLHDSLSCCTNGVSHDAVDCFFFVIPGNLFDERKPRAGKTNFQSRDSQNDSNDELESD